MTRGSWVVDDLSRHRKNCTRCDIVLAAHESRSSMWFLMKPKPGTRACDSTPSGLCDDGRPIFEAWRTWATNLD